MNLTLLLIHFMTFRVTVNFILKIIDFVIMYMFYTLLISQASVFLFTIQEFSMEPLTELSQINFVLNNQLYKTYMSSLS